MANTVGRGFSVDASGQVAGHSVLSVHVHDLADE